MTTKLFSHRSVLPGDILVYIVVAAAAVLSSFALSARGGGGPVFVEVTSSGTTTQYSLDADSKITLTGEGYTLLLVIEDGSVHIEESDCPDKLCVKTGKISRSGQSIVCVPARISVRLTGGNHSSDAVAG